MRPLHTNATELQVHRGSRYGFYVALKDADNEALDLTSYWPVVLKIADSWRDDYSFLEIEAELVCEPEDGEIVFNFLPEHTEDLSIRGYDMTIVADEYTVLHGRFGVLPRNRPAQEED